MSLVGAGNVEFELPFKATPIPSPFLKHPCEAEDSPALRPATGDSSSEPLPLTLASPQACMVWVV